MLARRSTRVVVGLAAAALAVSAGPALAATSSSGGSLSPTATVAATLNRALSLGAAPASASLPVTVSLAPRNVAGLDSLIAAQANPASPQYHRYLTPAEFAARYGATPAQVTAVTSYLRSKGFSDLAVSPNRLAVSAVGTAGTASQAFHTSLGLFRQDGRDVVANTTTALVPSALSGVVSSVIGLNQAFHAVPLNQVKAATGGSTTYNPPAFASAYDAKSLPAATGTSIAIMAEGALGQVVTDLRTEEKANGLPQVPVTIVPTGAASTDTSGLDEWDLDSQTSTAIAGNVKQLYLYDAPSLNDSDIVTEINAFVSQDKATAGSASFGECDSDASSDGTTTAVDNAVKEAIAQGQTLFASSGDSGSACSSSAEGLLPGPTETSFPASGTYTTAVGGTTLNTTSAGTYSSETAWDGSGGGRSSEATPSWATKADATAPAASSGGGGGILGLTALPGLGGLLGSGSSTAASGGRGVPDLAMDADPNTGANIVVNGSVETVGGTSLASPLALGGWARIQNAHGDRLGDAGQDLYGLYNQANPSKAGATPGLHDVTSGSNGAYSAATGYDLVTGLGTLDVAAVSKGL